MIRILTPLLLLSLAVAAAAQETTTVIALDGSRTTGRFEAWNRDTNVIYVRASLHDQRKMPLDRVAVIAVGGDADQLQKDELARVTDGKHLLVLRNGQSYVGRLVNIEGGEGSGKEQEPRVLSFAPESGAQVRTPFADVRRLYLARVDGATTSTLEEPAVPAGGIRVPAAGGWVATGIFVRSGDRVQFGVTGTVQLSTDTTARSAAAGVASGDKATGSLAPLLPLGALIGRIGTGAPFGIGDQRDPLPMPASGELFLAVNDDHAADNQGAFAVTIRTVGSR